MRITMATYYEESFRYDVYAPQKQLATIILLPWQLLLLFIGQYKHG